MRDAIICLISRNTSSRYMKPQIFSQLMDLLCEEIKR